MGMEIRAELVLGPDIGLDDGPLLIEAIVLGLTHERLGNRGNLRLDLHAPVRINIGHFRIPEPEYIELPVIAVDIAGHDPPDDQKAVFSRRERQPAERRQVPDQISGPMVRCGEHKAHSSPLLSVQVHDHIFLFIKVKALKPCHGCQISSFL